MIVVRDLPGFAEIEDKVRLYYRPNEPTSPEFDRAVVTLSEATFGSTEALAYGILQALDGDLPPQLQTEQMAARIDELFDLAFEVERSDDDAVAALKSKGLDFSDAKGWPLLCTRFFKWQALLAVTGTYGRMPDVEAAGLRRMETSLEAEVRAFTDRKRR